MKELSAESPDPDVQEVAPRFTEVASDEQSEFRIYALLSPGQQQAVREQGLALSWQEMPPAARDLFARRVGDYFEPGIGVENVRRSSLFIQFHDDQILVRYLIAGVPPERAAWQRTIHQFAPARPVRAHSLVGLPAPDLQFETESGQAISLQPPPLRSCPLLLYLAPAWPRPVVARREEFADLRALQRIQEAASASHRVLVLGTGATAAELRTWWKERGLSVPPRALAPESARAYGVRGQSVAVIVDAGGLVAWAKEGYTPGDEAEWQRQLERGTR